MSKKRIFDVIGTVIATLIATLIINDFDLFKSFFAMGFMIKTYFFLFVILFVSFISFLSSYYYQKAKTERLLGGEAEEKSRITAAQKTELLLKDSRIAELQKELNEHIDIMSKDDLTGAYNNNQTDKLLADKLKKAKELSRTFTLIMADIDGFKRINDTYDHEVGNFILQQVADVIRPRSLDDQFIRYGGEEFLIISRIGDDKRKGYDFADRIRKDVREYEFIIAYNDAQREHLTISCGVKVVNPDTDDITQAKKMVAQALHQAKNQKHNGLTKDFVYVVD